MLRTAALYRALCSGSLDKLQDMEECREVVVRTSRYRAGNSGDQWLAQVAQPVREGAKLCIQRAYMTAPFIV